MGDGGYGNTTVRTIRDWCRAWAVPLGKYLKDELKLNPDRWSVNATWRIDTVKRIMERVRHLRFIEWMPMCMKTDTCRPGDLDQAVDIDVYWKSAEVIWVIDVRRKL